MIEAGKVSVVLVDDSVDVRTLVRMRLESSGLFDVKGEAADGEQAIALVIRHEPTLVLLDVSMPRMDGLETLPSILAVRPETAVVMFSGFGGTHLAAEVRELGAIDFIEKSIPLEQLPERLLQSLQGTSPEPVTPPPPPPTSPHATLLPSCSGRMRTPPGSSRRSWTSTSRASARSSTGPRSAWRP